MADIAGVLAVVQRRYIDYRERRNEKFAGVVRRLVIDAASFGGAQGEKVILKIRDTARNELDERLAHAITMIDEALNKARLAASNVELRNMLTTLLALDFPDVRSQLERALSHFGPGHTTVDDAKNYLESYQQRIVRMAENEADSLALTRRDDPAVSVRIAGNVGAVQTGAGSHANVVQNNARDTEALLGALRALRDVAGEAIVSVDNKPVAQWIDDVALEAAKSDRNPRVLGTLLGAVSTAVQGIAAAGPAYQALKTASAAFGITLP